MRMGVVKSAVLAVALAAALVALVLARQFTDDEKQGLADAVKAFNAAMTANDFSTVVDASISPKLLEKMDKTNNVPADQLKTLVVQQMQQTQQTDKNDTNSMDLTQADYEEAKDGTP